MKIALDTNFLAYATGVNDIERQNQALDILQFLVSKDVVLSVQVLAEFYRVLTAKAHFEKREAAALTLSWQNQYRTISMTSTVFTQAIDLLVQHRFSIWDALVVAAAAEAECDLLLSEDMHHGFTWSGVTIVNPFADPKHPMLRKILDDPR